MRIISKFKDYYDIGLKYGIDPRLIYKRTQEDIFEPVKSQCRSSDIGTGVYAESFVIGFCGKTYPGVRLYHSWGLINRSVDYYYNSESLKRALYAVAKKDKHAKRDILNYLEHKQNKRATTKFEKFAGLVFGGQYEWRQDLKAPIYVMKYTDDYGSCITKNSQLSQYNFASVVDPYTAFNELSMWIGNFILQTPKMIQISNEDMRHKKGFDNSSFKRYKHPRKSKRKKL